MFGIQICISILIFFSLSPSSSGSGSGGSWKIGIFRMSSSSSNIRISVQLTRKASRNSFRVAVVNCSRRYKRTLTPFETESWKSWKLIWCSYGSCYEIAMEIEPWRNESTPVVSRVFFRSSKSSQLNCRSSSSTMAAILSTFSSVSFGEAFSVKTNVK